MLYIYKLTDKSYIEMFVKKNYRNKEPKDRKTHRHTATPSLCGSILRKVKVPNP